MRSSIVWAATKWIPFYWRNRFRYCSKGCFLNQLIARVNMPRFPAPCQRVWMLARTMKVKAYKVAARIQDTQYFLERYAGDGRLPVVEETKVIRGILS